MALTANHTLHLEVPPRSYGNDGIIYRAASPEDDGELRAALREIPMDGWVRLAFEREPTLFAGENRMGPSSTYVARDLTGALVGTYSLSHPLVHVNSRPERVGYLCGLRVQPEQRHKIRVMKGGFASLAVLPTTRNTLPFYFTSIAHDNHKARRLLEARLKGMPAYHPVGELGTYLIHSKGKTRGLIQQAQTNDVPALVRFFNAQMARYAFSPVLTEDWLLALNGEQGINLSDFFLLKAGQTIRGCLALWDQRSFNQCVVKSYRFPLNHTRPFINFLTPWKRFPPLPKPGERLNMAFLAFMAFDQNGESEAAPVIQDAASIAFSRGIELCAFGLSPFNPLVNQVKKIAPRPLYRTVIETVTLQGTLDQPFLEGPPQPEIALL